MSIFKGYKTVLIKAYEGEVLIECKRNTSKSDVLDIARTHFQEKLNKPLTHLNNVEYLTESQCTFEETDNIERVSIDE